MPTPDKLVGKIKWKNIQKGYGFITLSDAPFGEVYFNAKQLLNIEFDLLEPNTVVEFVLGQGIKGKKEALSIAVLKSTEINLSSSSLAHISAEDDVLLSILKENNLDFNKKLLNTLLERLPAINQKKQFQQAQQLIYYSQYIEPEQKIELLDNIFQRSNPHFRFQLWLMGTVNYVDFTDIQQRYQESTNELKLKIDHRLNQYKIKQPIQVKSFFSGILVQLLEELNAAEKSIRVAVAWFTHHQLFDLLCLKVNAGVKVELIIINDYINNWEGGLPFQQLINAGGVLYLCGPEQIMHHKFCLIDGKVLINGSYNWTYYAAKRNRENCMFFYQEDKLYDSFNQEFDYLIKEMKPTVNVVQLIYDPDKNDFFSRRQYQSLDLTFYAETLLGKNEALANQLLTQAITIFPENGLAKILSQELTPVNETIIREAALKNVQSELHTQHQQYQNSYITAQEIFKHQEIILKEEKTQQRFFSQQSKEKIERENDEERKNVLQVEEESRLEKLAKETKEKEAILLLQQQQVEKQEKLLKDSKAMLGVVTDMAKKSLEGERGQLRINLSWNTQDDLDLHIIDPDNNHIHYSKKEAICQNFVGRLDVDANAGVNQVTDPQENIFWQDGPPIGNYQITVVHYNVNKLESVPFAVTIIPAKGSATIIVGIITKDNNRTPLPIANLSYNNLGDLNITKLLPDLKQEAI